MHIVRIVKFYEKYTNPANRHPWLLQAKVVAPPLMPLPVQTNTISLNWQSCFEEPLVEIIFKQEDLSVEQLSFCFSCITNLFVLTVWTVWAFFLLRVFPTWRFSGTFSRRLAGRLTKKTNKLIYISFKHLRAIPSKKVVRGRKMRRQGGEGECRLPRGGGEGGLVVIR